MKPCRHASVGRPSRGNAEESNEHVLGHISGFVGVSDDAERESHDRAVVLAVELVEGLTFTRSDPCEQLGIALSWVGLGHAWLMPPGCNSCPAAPTFSHPLLMAEEVRSSRRGD